MNSKVDDAVARLNSILPLRARQETLSAEVAALYLKILKSYVDRGRSMTRAEMAEYVDDVEAAINILRSNDMVVFDESGEPTGAYPFTMEVREHQVQVNNQTVHAMCALDALAISPMFNIETHIDSRCHVSGDRISIDQLDQSVLNIEDNRDVYFGISWSAASSCCSCSSSLCTEMIFLKGQQVAEQWLAEDAENREIFTLDEAIAFATGFFSPLVS